MSVNAMEFIILQLNVKRTGAVAAAAAVSTKRQSKRECEFMTDYKKDIFPSFPFRKINTSLYSSRATVSRVHVHHKAPSPSTSLAST